MIGRLALLAIVVIARATACSCGGNYPSVKQAWQERSVVFLGTVELADPDIDASRAEFDTQSVRIHVDDAFKGVSSGQTLRLQQGASDCDAKFRTGQRAVFYLERAPNGNLMVPWCTLGLGTADPAGDDLLFLRGLPASAKSTRLSGTVELYEDTPAEAFKRIGGIPGVRVKISGPRGFIAERTTNSNGVYELYGLNPGRYSVSIETPKNLKIKFPITTGSPPVPADDAAVELVADGGASVDFILQADTRLSGRILDAKGEPASGVCLQLEFVEGRSSNRTGFTCSKKPDGTFEMTMMSPGKYWLVVNDDVKINGHKSKSTLYSPGVRDRERGTIVSIEAGQYVKNLDIRFPKDEKRYEVAGRVQFADGVAAGDRATVTFTSAQHGYSETAETARDGSFDFFVVGGMEGQLMARISFFEPTLKSCPELKVEPEKHGIFRFADSNTIPLTVDSDDKNIVLELPSPHCSPATPGSR